MTLPLTPLSRAEASRSLFAPRIPLSAASSKATAAPTLVPSSGRVRPELVNACATTPRCARHPVSAARAASPELHCLEPNSNVELLLASPHYSPRCQCEERPLAGLPAIELSNPRARPSDRSNPRARHARPAFDRRALSAEIRGRLAFAARRSIAICDARAPPTTTPCYPDSFTEKHPLSCAGCAARFKAPRAARLFDFARSDRISSSRSFAKAFDQHTGRRACLRRLSSRTSIMTIGREASRHVSIQGAFCP